MKYVKTWPGFGNTVEIQISQEGISVDIPLDLEEAHALLDDLTDSINIVENKVGEEA